LFGTVWQRAAGDTRQPGDGHPARIFGVSFLFALLASVAYASIVPAPVGALQALAQGLSIGAGIVGASFGINDQSPIAARSCC
jgi:hypothetical protein